MVRLSVDALIAQLTSKRESARSEARHALHRLGDEAVPALANALAGRDPELFAEAAAVLATYPPVSRAGVFVAQRDVLEGLVCGTSKKAKHRKWMSVRSLAVELLGGSDMPDSVTLLTVALRDRSPAVRSAAANALAQTPDHLRPSARRLACETLIELLNTAAPPSGPMEAPDCRPGVATALGRLGCREAVPHLITALADSNFLCVQAASALGMLRDPAAITPLIEVLNDGSKFWVPRGNAAVVLGHMGTHASAAIPALREAITWIPEGDTWDSRCTDGVRDALNHLADCRPECLLTARKYRYEMWGIH